MTATFQQKLLTIQSRCLAIGSVAFLCSVVGAFFSPTQFFFSYLFSYIYWIGLAAGCVIVAMIHYLTGGGWGHPIRRFLEAGYSTFPLMALLFVPLLFGLDHLYPWARVEELTVAIRKKQPYLSVAFFIARAVSILALWVLVASRLRKWSLTQDETKDPRPSVRLSAISGPGLVIVPLTATFAYIDWVMSTEPNWCSTIFAIIMLAGQVLVAFALAIVLLRMFEQVDPIASIVSRKHYHQLGNLLLTFVLFCAYAGFSQLLIVYAGNKPGEIAWYLHRISGGWRYLIGFVAIFHFFLPFFLLLFRAFKRRASLLATLAAGLMLTHLIYAYWLIGPSFFPDGIRLSWLNFAVPIALGGIWIAAFLNLLRGAALIPANDPRIEEALPYA